MNGRVATVGVMFVTAAGVCGCGAQQKIEHAVTSARHVVQDGEKVRKQIEQEKPTLEQRLLELEQRSKDAREALQRGKSQIVGGSGNS